MRTNQKYISLKELHFTYEKNFLLFLKLLPELKGKYEFLYGLPEQDRLIEIRFVIDQISQFTSDIKIHFKDYSLDKDIEIETRLYLEAKMAEVIKFRGFHNSLISIFPINRKLGFTEDERFQWNSFLSHFLTLSINSGRSLENYIPTRV